MNTMRATTQPPFATSFKVKKWERRQWLQTLLLFILIIFSSFAVVYVKDLHRRMFIYYQVLKDQQNQLIVDWGKLLLEQSTWSTQGRVQKIASKLGMEVPQPSQIQIVND